MQEVMACLKHTFQKARSDSSFQSIDESMTKFKGRSSLKQFLPLKPVKRGIKIWVRSDAQTGYVYDMNIYCGKELEQTEGTLGERVVAKLCNTINAPPTGVSLCFDRFFTSVHLMNTIRHPAVGTCMLNRRNMPKFAKSTRATSRGESEFYCNQYGTLAVKWKDTKDVVALSNCHTTAEVNVLRTNKDGSGENVNCPESIAYYNAHMGGVDLSDQLAGLYDMDRKSLKWWKKVFFRLLMTCCVNSWIIFREIRRHSTLPFLDFLVCLAEQLIATGRSTAKITRKRLYGRPSKSSKTCLNVGDHLPVEGPSRRRCHNCTKKKNRKTDKNFVHGL
nr:unnamed protein product [Callosobruchus chinensis]